MILNGAQHKGLIKIDPCYRWQICSPGTIVSANIKFMHTFAGSVWLGGIKQQWGGQKWRTFILWVAIILESLEIRLQFLCGNI